MSEDASERLEALIERLEDARGRLEAASGDPDAVLPLLAEVNELAQTAAAEVERARGAALEEDADEHA